MSNANDIARRILRWLKMPLQEHFEQILREIRFEPVLDKNTKIEYRAGNRIAIVRKAMTSREIAELLANQGVQVAIYQGVGFVGIWRPLDVPLNLAQLPRLRNLVAATRESGWEFSADCVWRGEDDVPYLPESQLDLEAAARVIELALPKAIS